MNTLFSFDKDNKSLKYLIGTDEVGRGPLAGPVVAAAVCFVNLSDEIEEMLQNINDSKKLSHIQRTELCKLIKENAIYSIKSLDVKEIEKINILQAALKAMRLACLAVAEKLGDEIEIFVDGKIRIPNLPIKQKTFVKGDGKSASIAAASILAKVHRDNLMCEYAKQYPNYDWQNNKGYGTKKHIDAIKKHGLTSLHRKSFLKKIIDSEKNLQLKLKIE